MIAGGIIYISALGLHQLYIIVPGLSRKVSSGICSGYYLGTVSGCRSRGGLICWYDLGLCSRTASGVPGAVSVVSVTWLQTSAGLLSDFPAVSVVCLPATAPGLLTSWLACGIIE